MKPRILVVDDDEAITQQLLWTLSEEYEVMVANDMQTAVRRLMIYPPDVSILDLHLPPEVDTVEVGLRVLEYIKSHVPKSKVLVISASNEMQTRKVCYAVGADEFLGKPFDTEQLLATMRRMVPSYVEIA